ncbi:hypothetical protein GCM10009789_35690 [Kribbella sancticallisti]|uniref:FXSXX-COOH protein n=1 Tax=Kribbella sancticallisti TaxID=460087 RepID=A0ABP4PGS6_9ACTN
MDTNASSAALQIAHTDLEDLELGQAAIRQEDLPRLLSLYAVTDEAEIAVSQALGRQSDSSGWWHEYADLPTRPPAGISERPRS